MAAVRLDGGVVFVVVCQIVGRVGRHREHLAGLDVHDNGAAATMDRKGAHRLGQVLLDDGLYVLVDGQKV